MTESPKESFEEYMKRVHGEVEEAILGFSKRYVFDKTRPLKVVFPKEWSQKND